MNLDKKRIKGPIVDETYELMMVTHGKIVALLESQGMSPCLAVKVAHEVMKEAFDVWSMLVSTTNEDDSDGGI